MAILFYMTNAVVVMN